MPVGQPSPDERSGGAARSATTDAPAHAAMFRVASCHESTSKRVFRSLRWCHVPRCCTRVRKGVASMKGSSCRTEDKRAASRVNRSRELRQAWVRSYRRP